MNIDMLTVHDLRRSVVFDWFRNENSYMTILTNRSHKGAYATGKRARAEGLPRTPPYAGNYYSRMYMERAWLMGYDAKPKKADA